MTEPEPFPPSTKALLETVLFFFPVSSWDFGLLTNTAAFALVMLQLVQVKVIHFSKSHWAAQWHFIGNLQKYLVCQDLLSPNDWAGPASSGRWEEDHKEHLLPAQQVSIRKPEKKLIRWFGKLWNTVSHLQWSLASTAPCQEKQQTWSVTTFFFSPLRTLFVFYKLGLTCEQRDWKKKQAGAMQVMSSSVLSLLLVWKPCLQLAGKCRGC